MWKVSSDDGTIRKISSQTYDGKTYDELLTDRINITKNESTYIYWNSSRSPNIIADNNQLATPATSMPFIGYTW